MRNITLFVVVIFVILAISYFTVGKNANAPSETAVIDQSDRQTETEDTPTEAVADVSVTPISHATMVLDFGGVTIYTDPVGGAEVFESLPPANIILVTDIHGDHLDAETLAGIAREGTIIIAPQAVVDELPESERDGIAILANGETTTQDGLTIRAMPMYNLPESPESRHVKGRGNGYVIEGDGVKVYIAGDTAGIPEMRALEGIDIAFMPMNLPYTMGVDEAADAVLDFAPAQVYPYHYRTPDGFSDINHFKDLVNAGNPNIEVIQLNWYPGS